MLPLIALLCIEIVLRIVLEIREARMTQLRGGVFAVLRVIPLVNDIVPLPENRKEVPESKFVKLHEEGHKVFHHAVLRNLMKIAFWMVAVWFMAAMMVRWNADFIEAVLWLHLAAIPFRMLFHFYCWSQEYECDRYALEKTDKKVAKAAMRELALCEIPHTALFALVYREHPTVALRSQRMLKKVISG